MARDDIDVGRDAEHSRRDDAAEALRLHLKPQVAIALQERHVGLGDRFLELVADLGAGLRSLAAQSRGQFVGGVHLDSEPLQQPLEVLVPARSRQHGLGPGRDPVQRPDADCGEVADNSGPPELVKPRLEGALPLSLGRDDGRSLRAHQLQRGFVESAPLGFPVTQQQVDAGAHGLDIDVDDPSPARLRRVDRADPLPVIVEPHAVAATEQHPAGGHLVGARFPRRGVWRNPADLRQQFRFVDRVIGRGRHRLGDIPDPELRPGDHDGALGAGGEHRTRQRAVAEPGWEHEVHSFGHRSTHY